MKLNFTFAILLKAGALAQLVEQRTENPCVPGSIPGGTTKKPQVKTWGFLILFSCDLKLTLWFKYKTI